MCNRCPGKISRVQYTFQCETVVERTGIWRTVFRHVDGDAAQRNDCRSASEEQNPHDYERQEAGKWHWYVGGASDDWHKIDER